MWCTSHRGTRTSSAASGSRRSRRVLDRTQPRHRAADHRGRRLDREDVELALDAAHAAKDAWGETSPTERAAVLNAIADAIENNQEMLAVAESWENGKPVRETLAADIPLVVDHFRYFAAAVRAEEGRPPRSTRTRRLPLPRAAGRRRPDHPVQLPAADGGVEAGPGDGRRQLLVLKPASPTPWSILKFASSSRTSSRRACINIVNGPGAEIGKALATNPRIAKIAFTGETVTGRLIMQYAAQNLIPSRWSSAASRRTSSSPT